MEEEKEIVSDVEMALSMEHTKQGLGVIGKHPVLLNHTFLELKVIDAGVGTSRYWSNTQILCI